MMRLFWRKALDCGRRSDSALFRQGWVEFAKPLAATRGAFIRLPEPLAGRVGHVAADRNASPLVAGPPARPARKAPITDRARS
jgi:hypothetical protein